MTLELNFNLVNSMFWAYFIGVAITLGVGTGAMFLAYFQQKLKPKDKEAKNGN